MTPIVSGAAPVGPTRPWPAERVEQWPIEQLIPYANNPRLHSASDVEKIAGSILKWGWTTPVLVDEQGVLIAGHGRVAAAAKLGLAVPIPVIVARGWSEEEKQAYRLADKLPVTFRARMTNQATGSGRLGVLTLPVVAVRCFNRGLSGGISDERTLCFF